MRPIPIWPATLTYGPITPGNEASCAYCGDTLYVGDQAINDQSSCDVFCSYKCAAASREFLAGEDADNPWSDAKAQIIAELG